MADTDGVDPSGVTEAVAERYREILPAEFTVETNGPFLTWRASGSGASSMFFGNWMLHVPWLSKTARLERFAQMAFGKLPREVASVMNRNPSLVWPARGTTCHVRVTDSEVHIWFGMTDQEADAVLKVRPISREELGI